MDWISVYENVPTIVSNKVIVCCKNGYVGFGHFEKFNGEYTWFNLETGKPFLELGDGYDYEVTHWQGLPKPPID